MVVLGTYAVLWSLAWAVCGCLAPAADRLLLPGSAVLNGLGLVMIHHIDLGEHAQYGSGAATDAPQQLLWTLVALVGFAGCWSLCTTIGPLRATPTPPAWLVWCCCWFRRCCRRGSVR